MKLQEWIFDHVSYAWTRGIKRHSTSSTVKNYLCVKILPSLKSYQFYCKILLPCSLTCAIVIIQGQTVTSLARTRIWSIGVSTNLTALISIFLAFINIWISQSATFCLTQYYVILLTDAPNIVALQTVARVTRASVGSISVHADLSTVVYTFSTFINICIHS